LINRDSIGVVQEIKPGAVNVMTSGSGIVHSERTGAETCASTSRLFGTQTWVALPKAHEEMDPAFDHVDDSKLPRIAGEGNRVRLFMGSLYGETAPTKFPWDIFYAEAVLAPSAILPLDPAYDERAVYVVSGEIDIAGDVFGPGRLLIFKPGVRISILATSQARIMLLGGEPMDGPRNIWWNFVSSRKERIEQAKAEWRSGKFSSVPGEHEFIPLPE